MLETFYFLLSTGRCLGVEPWSYYFVNCFLNFNVVFVMALFSLPFVVRTTNLLVKYDVFLT